MTDEKLKIWLSFAKFLLGTFALGLVTTLINNAIQTREIEIKEQEQVGHFLQHALQEDVGVRRRFSQYFSAVTRSEALRKGWNAYNEMVEREYQEIEREKKQLQAEVAEKNIDPERKGQLNTEIARLEQMLGSSTKVKRVLTYTGVSESEAPFLEGNLHAFGATNIKSVKQPDGTYTVTGQTSINSP